MNIFNWAQDHNVIWIENIDWWLLHNHKRLYSILHPSNGLNKERAENICRLIFNKICIDEMGKLVRLIGFGDDEEDFYYITKNSKGEVVWHSMVGGLIPLKGRISNWDYWKLERGFSGWEGREGECPPEKRFISVFEPSKFSFSNFDLDE